MAKGSPNVCLVARGIYLEVGKNKVWNPENLENRSKQVWDKLNGGTIERRAQFERISLKD
jgi:hypothetical protein